MKKRSPYVDLCYVSILFIQLVLGIFWLSAGQANAGELTAEQPTAIGPGPTSTIEGIDLEESMRTPGPMEAPVPFAPGQGPTVEGINIDENADNTGFLQIPPDPIGAAGPDHLVSVVNSSIEWHTKAGIQENSQSLKNFFPQATTSTFDPKVIYDQFEDRFLVVTLERVEVAAGQDPGNVSSIFIAVSDDSNPDDGNWHFAAINAKEIIGGSDHWADYPGFAVDEEAVYITANMFSHVAGVFGGTRLWIIDKGVDTGGFYDGGAASTTRFDFPTIASTPALTTQPAHIFGTSPPGNVGTFLVQYSGLTVGGNLSLNIIRVDDPLESPAFSPQFVNVGNNIDDTSLPMPNAPQSGTTIQVETNDRRVLNAVWRDNSLWITAQVVPVSGSDAGQTTAHWWELDTTNLTAPPS